jgi:hypothetical protein
MSRSRGRLVPVLLATLVLVAGANLASYAASGGPLLVGKGNKATKTTKLKNAGSGPALALTSKPGTASLSVSDTAKVTNLNADLVDGLDSTQLRNADTVDGLDSSALRNKTYVYALSGSTAAGANLAFPLAGLPPGKYFASYSVAAGFATTPTYFACYFASTAGTLSTFSILTAAAITGAVAYVSGSGYLDTTAATKMLGCERTGGGTMTLPAGTFSFPSQVTLTMLDDVTSGTSTGAPFTPVAGRPATQR